LASLKQAISNDTLNINECKKYFSITSALVSLRKK
jgi:hypothetical protein